jgi:membrane-bound serine protease (ClpP class)
VLATIVVLALFGTAAIVLEVFLPGGVLGVAGAAAVVTAAVLTVTSDALDPAGLGVRVLGALAILAGSGTAFALSMRHFPKTRLGRKLTLESANTATSSPAAAPALAGRTGTAETPLHPSGRATIDGRSYEVIAESGSVETGGQVTVTRLEGPLIYVRKS